MKLIFYDENLKRKEMLFSWTSLLWRSQYNDIGSFLVEVPENNNLLGKIKEMDFVTFDEDPDTVMMVWGIEIRQGKFIISGCMASYLLSKRVSTEEISNENAEKALRRIVENMTPWNNVVIGELANIEDKYEAQTSDDSVLNYCMDVCQACDMGFRLRKSGEKLLFELYKPPLNRAVRFAENLGNMGNETYQESEKEFYNVAVVAGALDDNNVRITATAGDVESTGASRREMYVDARDIQPEEGETSEHYTNRLIQRGKKKLAEQIRVDNSGFVLSSTDVKLGDKVKIKSSYAETAEEKRITSITYKSSRNEMTRTAEVGQSLFSRRS